MKLFILLATICFGANSAIIPTTISGLNDSGSELWTLTDNNGLYDDSGFQLEFSYGSFNSSDHSFGLYQYDNVNDSISATLEIFDASNSVGDRNNVIWDFVNDTVKTRHGSIDLSLIGGLQFGFYFQSDGKKYYSQAALNDNEANHFGFYWDNDPFSTTNLIVYAGDNGTGRSYDHIQVTVDDVQKIPEPGSLVLVGIALLGFSVMRKAYLTNI